MGRYIYLVEIYKYTSNYKEMNHYVWCAYKNKEDAIRAIKDLIRLSKTENDKILDGNGDNCIGGLKNTINNDAKIYWINEITLK